MTAPMRDHSRTAAPRLGLCTILFLIFVTLKLARLGVVATWSWWWVAAPLWLPLAGLGAVLIIICLIAIITATK